MAPHKLEITRTAEKQLRRLERSEQRKVSSALLALAEEPRPRGCRKLSGYDDVYRIRVGGIRILYSVADERLVVLVIKIARRRDAYR